MTQMGIGHHLEGWHRRLAPVGAGMSLALVRRHVSLAQLEAWERELRDLADGLRAQIEARAPAREAMR